MRSQSITLLAAAALLALAASPALAGGGGDSQGGNNNNQGGNSDSQGAGAGKAVPGPIAGAGLGYLVLAGGYYVVRRWRKQKTGE
jgi:hypothetical protein